MDIQYLFRARSRARNRGFTLVELMIVVAIIGILAAMAVVGYSKFMRSAKTAEAKSSLGAIAKGDIAAYAVESSSGTGAGGLIAAGSSSTFANALCGTATATVPATGIAGVKGAKYQSTVADWNNAGDASTAALPRGQGWTCLKFSMDQPQYYVYQYTGSNVGTGTDAFSAVAMGDLNGDGVGSTFTYNGAVQNGRVVLAPSVSELNPEE